MVRKGRQATAYINDKEVVTINGASMVGGELRGYIRWVSPRIAEYLAVRESQGNRHRRRLLHPASPPPGQASRLATPRIEHHREEMAPSLCEDFLKYGGDVRSEETRG